MWHNCVYNIELNLLLGYSEINTQRCYAKLLRIMQSMHPATNQSETRLSLRESVLDEIKSFSVVDITP